MWFPLAPFTASALHSCIQQSRRHARRAVNRNRDVTAAVAWLRGGATAETAMVPPPHDGASTAATAKPPQPPVAPAATIDAHYVSSLPVQLRLSVQLFLRLLDSLQVRPGDAGTARPQALTRLVRSVPQVLTAFPPLALAREAAFESPFVTAGRPDPAPAPSSGAVTTAAREVRWTTRTHSGVV